MTKDPFVISTIPALTENLSLPGALAGLRKNGRPIANLEDWRVFHQEALRFGGSDVIEVKTIVSADKTEEKIRVRAQGLAKQLVHVERKKAAARRLGERLGFTPETGEAA
jgi:hypothetical protein